MKYSYKLSLRLFIYKIKADYNKIQQTFTIFPKFGDDAGCVLTVRNATTPWNFHFINTVSAVEQSSQHTERVEDAV